MIRLISVDSLVNEIYKRIKENKPFDNNLKPFSHEQVKMALDFFEYKEDYEKCQVLNEFINKQFKHGGDYLK